MPCLRCSNCGTEMSASVKNDAAAEAEPAARLYTCVACGMGACAGCFLEEDRRCGQCEEATYNGVKAEMDIFKYNLGNALTSPNPYVKRLSRKIVREVAASLKEELNGQD